MQERLAALRAELASAKETLQQLEQQVQACPLQLPSGTRPGTMCAAPPHHRLSLFEGRLPRRASGWTPTAALSHTSPLDCVFVSHAAAGLFLRCFPLPLQEQEAMAVSGPLGDGTAALQPPLPPRKRPKAAAPSPGVA